MHSTQHHPAGFRVLLGALLLSLGSSPVLANPSTGDRGFELAAGNSVRASVHQRGGSGGNLTVYLPDGEVLHGAYRLTADAAPVAGKKPFAASLSGTRGTAARCEGFVESGPAVACMPPALGGFKNNGPACRTQISGSCRLPDGALYAMDF